MSSSLAIEKATTQRSLEAIVSNACLRAGEVVGGCDFSIADDDGQPMSFDEVNHLLHRRLKRSEYKPSERKNSSESHNEEEEEETENEYYDRRQRDDQSEEMGIPVNEEESTSTDETDMNVLSDVSRTTMNGMRIFDTIADDQSDSFFLVQINGQDKYMHKQAANWYFSKTKPTLSSDRLTRVRENQ